MCDRMSIAMLLQHAGICAIRESLISILKLEVVLESASDLSQHKAGDALVTLTGSSPQRVQIQDLERNRLLLHALVRASKAVNMREAAIKVAHGLRLLYSQYQAAGVLKISR